jgi:hypothetical protein
MQHRIVRNERERLTPFMGCLVFDVFFPFSINYQPPTINEEL